MKKVNQAGYYHPDYINGLNQISFQNQAYSDEGVKLFDLDMGLSETQEAKPEDDDFRKILSCATTDQWLIAYNRLCNDNDEWISTLESYYKENSTALSNNPDNLLALHDIGLIALPETVVHALEHGETKKDELSSGSSGGIYDEPLPSSIEVAASAVNTDSPTHTSASASMDAKSCAAYYKRKLIALEEQARLANPAENTTEEHATEEHATEEHATSAPGMSNT